MDRCGTNQQGITQRKHLAMLATSVSTATPSPPPHTHIPPCVTGHHTEETLSDARLFCVNSKAHTPWCVTGHHTEETLSDARHFCVNSQAHTPWCVTGYHAGETLSDALHFWVFSTPQHTLAYDGITHNTIKMTLGSPKLAPWTCAVIFPSHRSDHILVTFSQRKPEHKPREKPRHLFKYATSDLDVSSQLQSGNPAQNTLPRQRVVIQTSYYKKRKPDSLDWHSRYVKSWQKKEANHTQTRQ